jgi:hypothetical protein
LQRILNFFEISQIISGKTPTKANLKRQLRENKDKFAYRICKFILNAQNCTKLFQITRKTYNMFKLTCVVSYSL